MEPKGAVLNTDAEAGGGWSRTPMAEPAAEGQPPSSMSQRPLVPETPELPSTPGEEPRKPSPIGRRFFAAGLASLALGSLGAGLWAGWSLNNQFSGTAPLPTLSVTVDRPIVVLEDSVQGISIMPSVVGLSRDQARQALSDAGINAEIAEEAAPYAGQAGRVIAQQPDAGASAVTKVTLTHSVVTTVPEFVGTSLDDVRAALIPLGVRVVVSTRYEAGIGAGTVLSTSPAAGEVLTNEVALVVAEAGSSLYLTDLRSITSNCRREQRTVNATVYPNSLVCNSWSYDVGIVEFALNRQIDRLQATVGLDDRSNIGSLIRFRALTDGIVVFEEVVPFGSSRAVDIPLTGALRLSLEARLVEGSTRGSDVVAVWGTPTLVGGTEAIARLELSR